VRSNGSLPPSCRTVTIPLAVQRELTCHTWRKPAASPADGRSHYKWECPKRCLPALDTGVPIGQKLDDLRPDESGTVEFNASHFFPPMNQSRIATAKVFMAQILYHFIGCTWGGCYNSLYSNVLVPHLDAPEVVDYVLRSPQVWTAPKSRKQNPAQDFIPTALSLARVASPRVRAYLEKHIFPSTSGTRTA